jgi:pimeloyl-ACP methyl ester carboxylesterase
VTRVRILTAVLALAGSPSICLAQTPADKFFNSNGIRIRFVEEGSGEPVVLHHGLGGTLQSWIDSGVFHKLAVDHRVIALDARGHGKSDKPHEAKQYGREMALDVVRLLDHLSIRRAHIVGYSMGAGITSQLLTLHPDRFLTATLAAAAGRFAWTADDERLARQEADEREKECVSRTLIYRLAPTNEPKPGEAEIEKRSKACFADATQDRFAIAALTRARGQSVIEPAKAAAVTVPTLGIVGDLDPALEGLQELKRIRPALQMVIIKGAVHSSADPRGAMRSPQFITSLRAFIASHREGSTR